MARSNSSSTATSPTSQAATEGSLTPLASPIPPFTAATSPPMSSSDGGSLRSPASSTFHDSSAAMGKMCGPSSKPPTLSDIAARMKLEGAESPDSTSSSTYGSHLEVTAPLKGRLGLAGRLNSSSPDLATGLADTDLVGARPIPVAFGAPPSIDRAASPPQEHISSIASGGRTSPHGKGKALPSLDEIRERMNKKGHAAALPTVPSTSVSPIAPLPASADETSAATSTTTLTDSKAISPLGTSGEIRTLADDSHRSEATTSRSPEKKAGWSLPPNPSSMLPPSSTKPLSTSLAGAWRSKSSLATPLVRTHAPGTHPLQHEWTLYFDSKQAISASTSSMPFCASTSDTSSPSSNASANSEVPIASPTPGKSFSTSETWEAALKKVGEYHTVESFMSVFGTIKRPSTLERNSNYHLFKDGIKPMWEDPANAKGGKWVLTFDRKASNPALVDRSWIWLVLALIGEELDLDDEVTGAVVSTRPKFDRIALWIRGKEDVKRVNRIGRKLIDLLQVETEPGVALEFSSNSSGVHQRGALQGSQSFLGFNNGAFASSASGSEKSSISTAVSGIRGGVTQNSSSPPSRLDSGRGSGTVGSGGFGTGGLFGRTNSASVGGGGLLGRSSGAQLSGKR